MAIEIGAPRPSRTNPPQRILVVEDDISIRQLSAEMLMGSGYEVDTAEDGAAGWEALQSRHYDLLITDNSMPKVTGFQMVRMLRGQDPTLPVIMATGAMPTEEMGRHPGLEINAILLKPYGIADLLETVKKVLSAPAGARAPIAPPPNRPSPPSADGSRPAP
jgi:DNA-binding response OmpR family regulator